jgi:hypothetical protein
MGLFRWIDRHLWSIPVLVFLVTELGLSVWSAASSRPVLLAAASLTIRQAIYSSLTGTSSTFFGIAVAVVTILVAFALRTNSQGQTTARERALARARTIVVGSLLASSLFLLVIVITATVALGVDSKPRGNTAITTLIEASGIASVSGLVVGGIGLALVIIERSQGALQRLKALFPRFPSFPTGRRRSLAHGLTAD